MAITLVGANVEVAGYKAGSYTSDTGQSATTIGKSAAGWTVNAYTDCIVWIISGTGAGASGIIASNTSTTLTVDRFTLIATSGAHYSFITPDNTSVFAVAWNFQDCVTALAANCSWDNTTTNRSMTCNKGIIVKAAGALGDYRKNLTFSVGETTLFSEAGSFFQMGRIDADGAGWDGGTITVNKTANGTIEITNVGLTKLYGTKYQQMKSTTWESITMRINAASSAGDGVHCINSECNHFYLTTWPQDVVVGGLFTSGVIRLSQAPGILKSTTIVDGVAVTGGTASKGINGADIFDYKYRGVASGVGSYNAPLGFYHTLLPYDVMYFWRPDFGSYALTACIDWNTTATYDAIVYIGNTIAISTKDSAASALASVAVGVIKTSDGTGQIVTAKQASGSNYAPTTARFITTDGSGDYAGPFGSGEGIFVRYGKLVHGASQYVSTLTDYSGYTLIFTKYGYVQQIQTRGYDYTNKNTEISYLVADAYSVAAYASAIAYTGIAMDAAAKTLVLSGARTFQEFYDYIKARVDYEAKTNDVHVVDPLTTTDGINYTLGASWTLTPVSYLTWSKRIGGGKIIYTTAGAYAPMVGTIALEFTAASGTYDLRTADITGTVTLTNTGGGSITVQLPVGVTVVNTGPNITVSQSASVNITVSGLVANSRVQIYDTNNTTELYNAVVTGTSVSVATSYTSDRPIRIRISNCIGTTAYNFIETSQTLTSTGLTYGASQTLDTTYNSNGIDGSGVTGITIAPSPARVSINLAGGTVTWPSIYAYQVYWLATATGIADEAAFIDAPDTANYILTGFDIKNTNANPLTITGGWGRDSVTLTIAGCIDVAGSTGNIYPQPDHIVAYAVGSALTSGQAAELTAVKGVTDQLRFTVANQVDANALTGGGGLDAAGTRAALGMASANLDSQLNATKVDVDAVKAKTDNLPADPASNTQVNTRLASASYVAPDNAGISALELSVAAIPTNPLLTTDARLNNLDDPISSRARPSDIPSAATVSAAIDAALMSDGLTYAQSKIVNDAILHGKVTGAGTATESFWSVNQASVLVERVRMTVDASGNRTAVTFVDVNP